MGMLVFIGLSSMNFPRSLLALIYLFLAITDFIDGFLSRRFRATTELGKILDLVSDKSLTSVSLLYAAAQGIDLFPLALIATRDVIMIGMRIVIVEGRQLLPTSRTFGGLMAILVWGNTFLLVYKGIDSDLFLAINFVYWASAIIFSCNLLWRIYVSRARIFESSVGGISFE